MYTKKEGTTLASQILLTCYTSVFIKHAVMEKVSVRHVSYTVFSTCTEPLMLARRCAVQHAHTRTMGPDDAVKVFLDGRSTC
jgi:hypothetical protein